MPDNVRTVQIPRLLLHLTAALLVVVGCVLLVGASESWALLRRRDAALGISVRLVLVLGGLLHVGAAGFVLAARSVANKAAIILWLACNCIVYYWSLVWSNVPAPFVALRVIAMVVGIRAQVLDVAWRIFMACLVIESLVVMGFEWRILWRLRKRSFLAHWKELREAGGPPGK